MSALNSGRSGRGGFGGTIGRNTGIDRPKLRQKFVGFRLRFQPGGPLKSRRIVFALVVAAACKDSTGTTNPCTDPEQGPFTGEAAVAVSGSLAGCSSFGVASSGGSSVTTITLSSGSPTNPSLIVNLSRNGARPAAGTYGIGSSAGQFSGSIFLSVQSRNFILSDGSVSFAESSAAGETGTLRGSLNVTGLASGSGEQLHVTGEFTAKCSAAVSVTC